jgi:hypothetical protein
MSIASPTLALKDRGDGSELGDDGGVSLLRIIEAAGGRWGFPCFAACCAAIFSAMVSIGGNWVGNWRPVDLAVGFGILAIRRIGTRDGPSARTYG